MIQPGKGGWTPGRIQLSWFIHDYLENGQESWAFEIHQAYKKAIQATPRHRGGKRKVISYSSFLNYMYILRKLGLIEYLRDLQGEIDTDEAKERLKKGETREGWEARNPVPLAPRHFIRANMSKIDDPAWYNPRKALYG